MSRTTPLRERALHLVREERTRQLQAYGTNDTLLLGFGSTLSAYPWLLPYSDADGNRIEAAFRADYEAYENTHGQPTWMHLIREEVSELFATRLMSDAIEEATQVAALCVSLIESLLETQGEVACH